MPKAIVLLAVTALVPVMYDHVRYEPGETLEIKEAELPQLLEVNAVKLVEAEAEADAAAPAAKAKK